MNSFKVDFIQVKSESIEDPFRDENKIGKMKAIYTT